VLNGFAGRQPADGVLNLPADKHSHGLRKLAATEASSGSFDGAVDAIQRATGQTVAKRQVEELAADAAVDFDHFYAQRRAEREGGLTQVRSRAKQFGAELERLPVEVAVADTAAVVAALEAII